ncbi:MAG: type I-D CRISPR-associated protein Cas7/Csc2 [Gaiellales bacterium]|nr:MAG: type I-D CRISPR-associated protein Cas7/Csc2 [Gaiellales bacterium]
MAVTTSVIEKLNGYLVEKPRPLIGAETIQLLLLREILDYTVLRTEETRELNSVNTPLSETDRVTTVKRVAFLGSKQKAAESRQMEYLLRTATTAVGKDIEECYLKDNLCLECPRCGLYGASALGEEANIKHRIEYSTAFSLLPFDRISEEITFNAVSELDQTTGQALGSRNVVKPASLFPSIVTLKAVTREELVLAIKTLLACKSYGAESRTGGDCRNTLFGVAAGWEELITPLELTLELYDKKDNLDPAAFKALLEGKYKALAGNPDRITMLGPSEVDALVKECAETPLDRAFLDKTYNDIAEYRRAQSEKK